MSCGKPLLWEWWISKALTRRIEDCLGSVKLFKLLVSKACFTHIIFNLSQFNQREITTNLLIATEDSHLLYRWLFNNNFQSVDSMKDPNPICIFQIRTRFFHSKLSCTNLLDMRISRDSKLFPSVFQDLIATIGSEYEQKIQDWPPPVDNSKHKGDPEATLNMLDAALKSSLERLKRMRESMSWAHNIVHYNYTTKARYIEHVNTIRNLSLGGRLGAALWLHNKMIHNNGVIPDVVTHNHLINGFCKVGAFDKAEWLIAQMSYRGPSPNCATYNTLMKGYCAFNDIEKALDLLSTMSDDDGCNKVKPNIVTFNILVHALCKKGLSDEARVLLSKLTDENRQKNLTASTILMDSYFKNGNTALARTLWGEICKTSKELDVVAYNVLIHGYYLSLDLIVVYKYVNEMLKIGLDPDNFTYNTLISGLCKVKRIDDACYLFNTVMSRMGVSPDVVSYNILIQGLCNVGNVGNVVKAHELLNCMLEKSLVPKPRIWNVIIHGYGTNRDKQNAFHVRDQMITHGVSPNVFTYNALIHMFIKTGEIFEAHLLMKEMLTVGPLPDTVTYNLLVGAESEYGHLYSAEQVYDDMLKRGYRPDGVTYTKLIKGYCMRGKVNEAERLFFTLYDSNLLIDHVPFQILMKKYFKMREFDSAYGVYQKWLRMD
ncbi:putative tetratricopeptide-like helical domain superfamily [Helianthus annuus]|uniref:Tetratricopeptide-like helical domain superfamily n=3 Tax=Helianthus annuus TaxID=4232 RepID=A0A9K3IN73_HELAN|nr:pentatricopeptide repeat-containing protein At5g24830 isoform X1 [Helianthus annuus]XP_021973874.1 pentatricopeptide repeat-containing protein At5g24830 isoform X1 [Helianthus annuus]XP_035831258.1 pentatricopeptide repeat-containing protein At5g24830 isoform X1 [Helianthus annuus]XP_035831259.1 pentatricopeptide repeat-containing protein At5g24830 isoform X1 [Helianthus annuus]KAF5800068.1 putative tetratricopeptide-like helical domain superfamily [Helianthus annuus]KAJ0558475.1 putative t